MNMRKKVFCLLMAVMLIVTMLAGCGGSKAPAAKAPPATQKKDSITVYVKAPSDWQNVHVWAWQEGGENAFEAWPGKEATFDETGYLTATVPNWVDGIVVSGNDGTIQTGDMIVEPGKDVWVSIEESGNAFYDYVDFLGSTEAPAKEFITVYIMEPADWTDVHVWAWKEGGEDAFDAWPGTKAVYDETISPTYLTATVPGWVDGIVVSGNDGTVQTGDMIVEPGRDVWIYIGEDAEAIYDYTDLMEGYEFEEPVYDDPLFAAAQAGDFDTVKEMLPTIDDRSILTDWVFNDFNYAYAIEAMQNGDYDTAIEFFRYCAYEEYPRYGDIIACLVADDLEGALAIKQELGFTMLESDLDKDLPEIYYMIAGIKEDPSDLNFLLLDRYLTLRMRTNQPTLSEDALTFGEHSSWTSEGYIGELPDWDTYFHIANLNTLYGQCGQEPNGKLLILRSQKGYQNGMTYYAVDLGTMEQLSHDLYPASLAEVEYILLANYDYNIEGSYQQTMSMGSNSVVDYFNFLRMKGQVQLIDATNRQTIQQSQWIMGTGQVEAYFGDTGYQCSNMPETGKDIIAAVEKVRQLNAG